MIPALTSAGMTRADRVIYTPAVGMPIPRMMAAIMVKISRMGTLPPARFVMMLVRRMFRPEVTREPMMMPAAAQAAVMGTALLAASSKAQIISVMDMRVDFLREETIKMRAMAMATDLPADMPMKITMINTARGMIRCPFSLNSAFRSGRSSCFKGFKSCI